MYHKLDDLLEEVNRVAGAATVEDLRRPVTNNLKTVYRKVGAASLWQGAVHHYEGKGETSFKLPEFCITPLKLVAGRADWTDFDPSGQYAGPKWKNQWDRTATGQDMYFNQAGDQLWLQSGVNGSAVRLTITGPLTLSYWRIPLDEEGAPLVDDRIWDAAKLFCQADEARISLHSRNKQSYSGVPYQVDKAEAGRAIDEARAECNKMTPNSWASFFKEFKRR